MKIVLASASPRRRELMKLITEDFTAISTDCDETLPCGIAPLEASEYLAELKARAAAASCPDSLVIGCDTTVICGGEILGKPCDERQCRAFLEQLSGRVHQVATGCCIIYGETVRSFTVVTDVTFRELSDEDIRWYISTDEPYDKAGGYGIQGRGALLIEKIDGDFYNVVGLPVAKLNKFIKEII